MSKRVLTVVGSMVVLILVAIVALALRGDGPETSSEPSGAGTASPSETRAPQDPPSVVASPPSDGTVDETIAPSPRGRTVTAEGDVVALPDQVTVSLLEARRAEVTPGGPGDVAGDAVVVELEITNGSDEEISIDTVMVTLMDGSERAAQPLTAEPYAPFVGSLGPGDSARSSYVFAAPSESRDSFVMLVEYVAGSGIARFGDVGPV